MSCAEIFKINATVVANEFIDKFMPEANGDYVKVYLYLLKNRAEGVSVQDAAERLRLTEGDVKRAVKYWEEKGLIQAETRDESAEKPQIISGTEEISANISEETDKTEEIRARYRRIEGKAVLEKLNADGEFQQILFMVQKYRRKILTETEQEVLAYLYDGLGLPYEVIDYLVSYCVETGHNSMRYIEKTGLDWAGLGIKDEKAARKRTEEFEEARAKKTRKAAARTQRNGITRNADLDTLVKAKILETM